MKIAKRKYFSIAVALAVMAASTGTVRAAGTEIVDSKGTLVGLVNGNLAYYWDPSFGFVSEPGHALRQVPDGQWVSFAVDALGMWASAVNAVALLYTSNNCMGVPYLNANSIPMMGSVVNASIKPGSGSKEVGAGTLYYASPPFQVVPISSRKSGTACSPQTPQNIYVGVAKSVKLSFSPPFSIK
jgi:hypothetical protein